MGWETTNECDATDQDKQGIPNMRVHYTKGNYLADELATQAAGMYFIGPKPLFGVSNQLKKELKVCEAKELVIRSPEFNYIFDGRVCFKTLE